MFIIALLLSSYLKAINIDEDTKFHDILSHSQIYIDKTKTLKLKYLINSKNIFKHNHEKSLSYGYAPDFNVWIKFTLHNKSNKVLHKILEYANPLTTDINFYSPADNYVQKEGLFHIKQDRKTINPIFKLTLQPQESKTYYLQVTSQITTLIVKLKLYTPETFYEKEIQHQFFIALFFASLLILGVYNFSIYIFTKDISYLYYVLYLFGMIFHHFIYIGLANIYFLSEASMIFLIQIGSFVVAFPVFFLALFTQSFIHLQQYKKLNKFLNLYLITLPFILVLVIFFDIFSSYKNIVIILLLLYLVLVTLYATFKKNRQAYFLLFGWIMILTAVTLMYLSSIGLLDIYTNQSYFVEIALVLEAVIFSIALADRIKQLQNEKNKVNAQLIFQQLHEQKILTVKVEEKTKDLNNSLNEKEMLLKELNHRVKNNMQTIISLIRLQLDDIDDLYIKGILSTTHNRITAMSHLHDLLYYETNISNVNASEYFTLLIDEIQETYPKNIQIHLNVYCELKIDHAVYCGLIVNELATNAFKYAFKENTGDIYITLSLANNYYLLSIRDTGVGYTKKVHTNSLGLILVKSLVNSKLKGEINTESKNGVNVKIKWKDKYE